MIGYYLIAYDQRARGSSCSRLEEAIKTLDPASNRVLRSTWCARVADLNQSQILNFLSNSIGEDDGLVVAHITESLACMNTLSGAKARVQTTQQRG